MAIYIFVDDELSFDSFNTRNNNIYRLNERQKMGDGSFQELALTGSPFGPTLQAEFPEIETFTRVEQARNRPLRVGDRQLFTEKQLLYVDSTFLEIFDFKLLYGDRATVLDEIMSIVLTRSAALKFFDDESDAIGKQILLADESVPYVITGILEDVPENSHIQFDGLISLVTYTKGHPNFNTDWTGNFLVTYFILNEHSDYKELNAKLPAWLVKWTEVPDINDGFGLFFQKLDDIHLASGDIVHDYVNYRKFNSQYVAIVGAIGIFILVIAAINFMNLTTARSAYRWKEIGVRKSIGAQKHQLFRQFVSESVLLAVLSLLIAMVLDALFLPLLNQWIGRQLALSDLFRPGLLLIIVAATITLGTLAALYPAVHMSSVKAIRALKGKEIGNSKPVFQSTLVVVQFGLAIGLIVGTLVISQQLSFIRTQDLGFNKDRIVLVSLNGEASDKLDVLKTKILQVSNVSGVTASGQRIGNNIHQRGLFVNTDKGRVGTFSSSLNVYYDYFEVYGIPLKQGRSFSPEFKTDAGQQSIVINQAMARELDLKEPVGTAAGYEELNGKIIGVVDDFKYNSLHHKVGSLSLFMEPGWGYEEMSIRINGGHEEEAIQAVKAIWTQVVPNFPFEYSYLGDHFENLYEGDRQLNRAVSIMTIIAILISCMGLFGLAALITVRKTREIGIRKILGASEFQILSLLSKNFVLLIAIAFVVITPVSYYLISSWLQNFAYRISISPMLFILGGFTALAIAVLTISYHTIKTARTNPVESLRQE
jgi:putative ABC transport system permease protein